MKNFIFKSDADFHKILFNKLDMMLTEQRHQRIDLSRLLSKINVIGNTIALQTQVDDYFGSKNPEDTAQEETEESK